MTPEVTENTVQAKSTARILNEFPFKDQSDADNKFLELAADYDNRENYVKTVDTATQKEYTFLDFTINIDNV